MHILIEDGTNTSSCRLCWYAKLMIWVNNMMTPSVLSTVFLKLDWIRWIIKLDSKYSSTFGNNYQICVSVLSNPMDQLHDLYMLGITVSDAGGYPKLHDESRRARRWLGDRRLPFRPKVIRWVRRFLEETEGCRSPKVIPSLEGPRKLPKVQGDERRSTVGPKVTARLRGSVSITNRIG